MTINEFIYRLGILVHNPHIWKYYRFLKTSASWNLNQLQDHQLRECKKLLIWAEQNSPFYKKLFRKADFHPGNFSSFGELARIPPVTKKDLRQNFLDIQIRKGFSRMYKTFTSGTTGEPLVFYRDQVWDAAHRAAYFRGLSWFGVLPWHPSVYVGGYNINPEKRRWIRLLDLLQNRRRLYSFTSAELKDMIPFLKKSLYLEGYSSMIFGIAGKLREMSLNIPLQLVKGTGDTIFPHYSDLCREIFDCPMVSEYGAAEAGIMAFECPEGNQHIVMENVIVEVMDNEIIITNLVSRSFPIIRYRINDTVEPVHTGQCKCGLAHQVIGRITGRLFEYLYGKTETYHAYLLYNIINKVSVQDHPIRLFQAVQKKKGQVTFLIAEKISKATKKNILAEAAKYFGEDMDCFVLDKTSPLGEKGKLNNFIGIEQYRTMSAKGWEL